MAALSDLVDRIREARSGGSSVPWFDPASAGVHAEALLLFEAPGARAVGPGTIRPSRPGSGFISPDNNDESAAAVFALEQSAALDRGRLLHWNIVPWYVGDGTRIRQVKDTDLAEAAPWLADLLNLLRRLRVLVLCGDAAQDGWDAYAGPRPDGLTVLRCPHPSPVNLRTRPHARLAILATFAELKSLIDPPKCRACGRPGIPIAHGMAGDGLPLAAGHGEAAGGGSASPEDKGTYRCAAGHTWQKLRASTNRPAEAGKKPTVPKRARSVTATRHADPHPDALFDGPLTNAQTTGQRVLRDLVAQRGTGAVHVGHLDSLAEVFDEWAREHADLRDGRWFFTGKGGTGLWHVLQGLCPIEDPTRWNGLRAQVVAHLEVSGRWRRTQPPRGSTFELLGSGLDRGPSTG